MISKKYLLYVPFVAAVMALGACQPAGGGSTPAEPTVSSITIKQGAEPQKEFNVGDDFSVAGGVLVVSYSDQTTKDVNMTLSMIENVPVMTTPTASYTVNVLYEGARTSYNISINEVVTVSSIAIKADHYPPQQFTVGDEFSVAGGVLVITKSNDTREEVNMTLAMITNAPNMNEPHENYTVNVSYEGASTSYVINVIPADSRAEVTISVSYNYNGNETAEAKQDMLFYVGEDYTFEFATDPEGALDSVSAKYYKLEDGKDPEEVGKPEEPGNYSYSVFIAEGDENYKPANVEYTFSIVDLDEYVLNKGHVPALGTEPSDTEADIDGLHFKFKSAKDTNEGILSLVVPSEGDSYVECQLAQYGAMLKGTLQVEYEGTNKYLKVYGSYDGENFELVDTLTNFKKQTNKLSNYFSFRLVAATFGDDNTEVTIKGLTFTYEGSGAPVSSLIAKAEKTDKTNRVSNVGEDGGYYRRGKEAGEVFDETKSKSSIGQKNQEVKARITFGYPIKARELKKYNFSFNCKPLNVDKCIYREPGEEYVGDHTSIYAKLVSGTSEVGDHKKLIELSKTDDWKKFDLSQEITEGKPSLGTNMADRFIEGNPEKEITGIDIWLSHSLYAADGSEAFPCVIIDDFRIFQVDDYPVARDVDYLTVSGAKTEYKLGDEFEFTGKVKAFYNDYDEVEVNYNDTKLTVVAPDMTTSGNKEVTVTYNDGTYTKSTTYTINIDGKSEEKMTIVPDADDYANVESRRNPEKDTYMGCAVASNETEMTYNDSKVALRLSGPTPEDYCYFTVVLPETITADHVTVKFFVRNLSSVGNLILQLRDDTEKVKAVYSESNSKADVTTDQTKTNKFAATDAGNGWTYFEHTYYTAGVTAGVKVLRIMFHAPGEKALTADQYCILDGIQVVAAA